MMEFATSTLKIGDERTAALFAALAKAQALAVEVDKASTGPHGYKYASAEAVMSEATRCLGECGLAFVCVGWSVNDRRDLLTATFVLAHEQGATLSGLTYSDAVIEARGRPLDKAIATALTYVQGYALRGLLNMPRVDAATEVDARDDTGYEPQSSRRRGGSSAGPSVRAVLALCEEAANITGETLWQVYDRAYRMAGGTQERSPKAKDLPPAALAKVHDAARSILEHEVAAERKVNESLEGEAP